MRRWSGALLLAVLSAGAGCEPIQPPVFTLDTGEDYDPDAPILVSTTALGFGAVEVNDIDPDSPPTLPLTLTNLSRQERPVYGYALIEGDDDAFFVDAEPYFTLGGGESRTLAVRFLPRTAETYAGRFTIEGGTDAVTLQGQGHAPVVALQGHEPTSTPVGCDASFSVSISNEGDRTLTLAEASFQGGDDFVLPVPLGQQSLAVGQTLELPVRFQPLFSWSASAEHADVLEVHSDDPRTPVARLPMSVLYARGPQVEEALTYYPGLQVDLLLLVDNTGVMATRVQKAADAIPVLTQTLLDANIDLNVAVLTGGDDCPSTRPAYLSSESAPEAALNALLTEGLWGASGTASGTLLQLALDALGNTSPGRCLDGFQRSGAILHVIVVSGQNDASGIDVDDQVDALLAAADSARGVMVSTLVATDPGGCSGMTYGVHYLNAALLTDGVQGSACDSDWSPALEEMALSSAALSTGSADLLLAEEPVPETLRITVDGDLYTGWSYTPSPPTIHFPQTAPPDTGSTVEVDYLAAVACPSSTQ